MENMFAIEKLILLVASAVLFAVGLVLTGINAYRARSGSAGVAHLQAPSRMSK